tara:strand:- start:461 stop:586 length:126 start_codon:yes stop_codon:yes gene_type:complete
MHYYLKIASAQIVLIETFNKRSFLVGLENGPFSAATNLVPS